MHIAHIGPPLSQRGGPAGYLRQLGAALDGVQTPHVVSFPDPAPTGSTAPPPVPSIFRRLGRRARAALFGAPRQYRPERSECESAQGPLHVLLSNARKATVEETAPALDAALRDRADVLFAHDPWTAHAALERRAPGQAVWLFIHTPMPLGLYVSWCCGVPEYTWEDVAQFPDVAASIADEARTWERVDRLVFPCPEARDEFGRVHGAMLDIATPTSWILTGARAAGGEDRNDRRAWGLPAHDPIVLFLGNDQPYRGLDALAEGVRQLGSSRELPGRIAVAGPDRSRVPPGERFHALGRVSNVRGLLASVDVFVSVNRFSLFDLSLVEALEAGKPLLLHNQGGNRAFERLGAGVLPIADLRPASIAASLREAFSLSPEGREALGAASRRCYEEHLTFEAFSQQHLQLYDECSNKREVAPSS